MAQFLMRVGIWRIILKGAVGTFKVALPCVRAGEERIAQEACGEAGAPVRRAFRPLWFGKKQVDGGYEYRADGNPIRNTFAHFALGIIGGWTCNMGVSPCKRWLFGDQILSPNR